MKRHRRDAKGAEKTGKQGRDKTNPGKTKIRPYGDSRSGDPCDFPYYFLGIFSIDAANGLEEMTPSVSFCFVPWFSLRSLRLRGENMHA